MLYGDAVIDKERIRMKYKPLKVELSQVEEQLNKLNKPSNNLEDSAEIEKAIEGMKRIEDLYVNFKPLQKKQFLKFFIKKAFVDTEEEKVVQYELVPEFEDLISRDLVRISSNWLPIQNFIRSLLPILVNDSSF